MVAKISVGSSAAGALAYNKKKVDAAKAKVLSSRNMIEGEDGELRFRDMVESFDLHLSQNQRTKKPIVHISLNPHVDDNLSDDKFVELAQEYMKRIGYADQPYVIFRHDDIQRPHIHIVTTNVDSTGRKIKDSNNYYLNKKVCRELEEMFGLRRAESQDERQSFKFNKVDATQEDLKDQIRNVIKPIAAGYKFQSFGEYRTLLSLYNISVEESKGVIGKREYSGLVYYATNDAGEKVSSPFKSSLFGKSVGHKAIDDRCVKCKSTIKDRRLGQDTAGRIAKATNGITDRDQFIEALRGVNIDVVLRESSEGRIYGATFIDHNNHSVFNGSRLGRDYSANAINDRFSDDLDISQPQSLDEPLHNHRGSHQSDDFTISTGGIFDLPTAADDPEEDNFPLAMQRKRKKKRSVKF